MLLAVTITFDKLLMSLKFWQQTKISANWRSRLRHISEICPLKQYHWKGDVWSFKYCVTTFYPNKVDQKWLYCVSNAKYSVYIWQVSQWIILIWRNEWSKRTEAYKYIFLSVCQFTFYCTILTEEPSFVSFNHNLTLENFLKQVKLYNLGARMD